VYVNSIPSFVAKAIPVKQRSDHAVPPDDAEKRPHSVMVFEASAVNVATVRYCPAAGRDFVPDTRASDPGVTRLVAAQPTGDEQDPVPQW
jgi:hypothetical protein